MGEGRLEHGRGGGEVAAELGGVIPRVNLDERLPELSMGMSGDLELAVAAGSTCVRVGSALFGDRPSA